MLLVEDVADADDRAQRRPSPSDAAQRPLSKAFRSTEQSVEQSGTLPERITLYRRPILDEWRSTRVSLEQLVAHIVIHEVGHHFGFSDDDMHALEDSAE